MPKLKAKSQDGEKSQAPRTRAEELYAMVQATVEKHRLRDSMLLELEPYYFLDEDRQPDEAGTPEDEHLQKVRMPHGTDTIDLVQGMLSDTDLQIVVPARSDRKTDLDLADQAEAWLQALLAENERLAGQALLERAAWLVAMRGAFCARVIFRETHLERDKGTGTYRQGRKPALLFQVRDPLVVYPEFGEDGLQYIGEQWLRLVGDIRQTWGSELLPEHDAEDEVEWCEYWSREEFCYWADGKVVGRQVEGQAVEGPWRHGYGDIPYVFRFGQQTGVREPERRARPLLEGVRHVIDGLDVLDTVELTTIHEYGGDSLILQSARDDFTVDLSPLAQNHIFPNESITWLRAGRQPFEAASARGKFESAFQRGTFPYSMYGQDPGRVMSGFSLSVLNQGGQVKLRRIIEAIEEGMAALLGKALMLAETQLAPLLDGGIVKAYTRGTHTTGEGRSRTVRQEVALKALLLDGYYEVDVQLGEVLPQDEQSNLVMAVRTQQPGPSGRPLLSWQTAVEKFKLVDSPAEERRRIDEEMVAAEPEVQALRRAIFAAKVKQELAEEAKELGIDIDAVLAMAQAGGQAQGPAPTGMEMPPGMPGTMLPAGMQGAGMGPEMMGPGMPGEMPPMF